MLNGPEIVLAVGIVAVIEGVEGLHLADDSFQIIKSRDPLRYDQAAAPERGARKVVEQGYGCRCHQLILV